MVTSSSINMFSNDFQDLNSEYNNLATQYGKFSIKIIRAFNKTYIYNPEIEAQDCHMMYKYIMNSQSVEAKTKVKVWLEEYSTIPHK